MNILWSAIEAKGSSNGGKIQPVREIFDDIKDVVEKVVGVEEEERVKMMEVLDVCVKSVQENASILSGQGLSDEENLDLEEHNRMMRQCSTTTTLFFVAAVVATDPYAKTKEEYYDLFEVIIDKLEKWDNLVKQSDPPELVPTSRDFSLDFLNGIESLQVANNWAAIESIFPIMKILEIELDLDAFNPNIELGEDRLDLDLEAKEYQLELWRQYSLQASRQHWRVPWMRILGSAIKADGSSDVEKIYRRFKHIKHVVNMVVEVKKETQKKMNRVLDRCKKAVEFNASGLSRQELSNEENLNLEEHNRMMRKCSTTTTLFFVYAEVMSANPQ